MCGISGIVDFKNPVSDQLKSEAKTAALKLAHRGPDYLGLWHNDNAVIAHNKLSILDFTDRSNQPVIIEDAIVVFNGEIYNYKELAAELGLNVSEMYSDAFVIAHGYKLIGSGIFEKLSGDFAIAIMDTKQKRLILARDRLGVKQIVYTRKGSSLRFASEAKALLSYSDFLARPNIDRIRSDLLMSFWSDKDTTYFEDIYHVPPGHFLQLDVDGVVLKAFWSLNATPDDSGQKNLEKIEFLLKKAARDRMIGEAKIGCLLSGGLDSSLLTAMIAKEAPEKPIDAFTIVYDDGEQNSDYTHAKQVACMYGNIHHVVNRVRKEDASLGNLDFISYHMEEVVWDKVYWSMFTNYKNAASRNLRVIINGQGSDEVWLGYYYDFPHYRFDESDLNEQNLVDSFVERNQSIWPFLSNLTKQKSRDIILETISSNFSPYVESGDGLNAIAAWATKTYLQSNLMQEDRMSMAASVECRVPFTDHNFIEAAFKLPGSIKVQDGIEKFPLKKIAKNYLPESICSRRKMAFVNPSSKYNQVISDYLAKGKEEIIKSEIMCDIFDKDFLQNIDARIGQADAEFSWKVAATYRFLSVYNFI